SFASAGRAAVWGRYGRRSCSSRSMPALTGRRNCQGPAILGHRATRDGNAGRVMQQGCQLRIGKWLSRLFGVDQALDHGLYGSGRDAATIGVGNSGGEEMLEFKYAAWRLHEFVGGCS